MTLMDWKVKYCTSENQRSFERKTMLSRKILSGFWKSLLFWGAVVPGSVMAQVQVLGFELNKSSSQLVKSTVGKHAKIYGESTNAYSGGLQFNTDGSGYGIAGLSEVNYIFDKEQRLAAVVMQLDKDRFDEIFKMLASKYKVHDQRRPFVGDRMGEFKPANATIRLLAPHMSFQMTAMYLRNDFYQTATVKMVQESQQKHAVEASKF